MNSNETRPDHPAQYYQPESERFEKVLAVLPHLLLTGTGAVGQFMQALAPAWFELYGNQASIGMVAIAGLVMILAFVYAWRRRWPLWSASWYGYWAWIVLAVVSLLNQAVGAFTGWRFNNFLILGTIGGMVAGYAWLVKRDTVRGMLAVLFLMPILALQFLEFIPPMEEGLLYLTAGLIVSLAALTILSFKKTIPALAVVLAANLLIGLGAAYVSVYRPEYPDGIMHIPSVAEFIGNVGLFVFVALVVIAGPLLFWAGWSQFRRRLEPGG